MQAGNLLAYFLLRIKSGCPPFIPPRGICYSSFEDELCLFFNEMNPRVPVVEKSNFGGNSKTIIFGQN